MNDYTIANLFYGEDIAQWNVATPFFTALWENSYLSEYEYGYSVEEGNPVYLWLDSDSEDLPDTIYPYHGISCRELDMLYLKRSGDKILTKRIVDEFAYALDHSRTNTPHINEIATLITRLYSQRWRDIWQTMFYEYDPIENYNMREQLTNDQKTTQYGKKDTFTVTNMQHKKTGSDTERPGDTSTETDQIYGYDSNAGVNADKRTVTRSGSNVQEYNSTETDNGTSNNQLSGTDTETRNYVLTRTGNIGVTTSQQMIEQQRRLLMFKYFEEIVFSDIDKFISLSVY